MMYVKLLSQLHCSTLFSFTPVWKVALNFVMKNFAETAMYKEIK